MEDIPRHSSRCSLSLHEKEVQQNRLNIFMMIFQFKTVVDVLDFKTHLVSQFCSPLGYNVPKWHIYVPK